MAAVKLSARIPLHSMNQTHLILVVPDMRSVGLKGPFKDIYCKLMEGLLFLAEVDHKQSQSQY